LVFLKSQFCLVLCNDADEVKRGTLPSTGLARCVQTKGKQTQK
jgi:hypothetical protein